MSKNCYNCKNAFKTNVFYEDIDDNQLVPIDIFVAFCDVLKLYVVEEDYCKNWECLGGCCD